MALLDDARRSGGTGQTITLLVDLGADDGSGGGNLAHRLGLRYAGGDDEEQQAAYDPLSLQFERLVYGDPYGAVGQ